MKKQHPRLGLIIEFLEKARADVVIVILSSLLSTILNALIPKVFRYAIDTVFVEGAKGFLSHHIWTLSLIVILIAAGNCLSIHFYRVYTSKTGETFAKSLKDKLFFHVQRLPMFWHDENQTGDIIQRCTADVETIRSFVTSQMLEIFRTVFLVLVSFVMMISMNKEMTLIAIVFLPVIVWYNCVFYGKIARQFTDADEAEGELSNVVLENATGVRVVRAFGREQFEIDRFEEKNESFSKLWINLGTLSGLFWGVGDMITGFQVIAVIVTGAVLAVHGQITAGEFVAFASYNTTLVWPIRSLGRILSEMSKAGVSFDRVNYILDSAEEEMSEEGQTPERTDIHFANVSFSYDKRQPVLQHIEMELSQGKTYGILGGTGSGKSTLMHLLNRLYELEEPENGSITIGGIDLNHISKQWLRTNIGIVLQEPFLFSRTIRENIASAVPDASMEEIRRAARIACVDETIMAFPDGYDTLVGERGVTLSGGQRQRVAIARMLLMKTPIMIFDDSLSAVDAQTDANIRYNLKHYRTGATVILISHRITTLMEADEIFVLKGGAIEEMGTHEELIRGNNIYRRIYDIQMNPDERRFFDGEE